MSGLNGHREVAALGNKGLDFVPDCSYILNKSNGLDLFILDSWIVIMVEKFGDMVRRLREARELGLRELARKAGISPSYLSMIEAGTADPPTVDKLERLAAALHTDRDLLVVAAGRIPTDIEKTIQADPQKVLWLLRQTKDTSLDALVKTLKGNSEPGKKD